MAAVFIVDQKLRVDDTVGAVALHGVNGSGESFPWAYSRTGQMARDGMAFLVPYVDCCTAIPDSFFATVIGGVVCIRFVFPTMYGFFKLTNMVAPLRLRTKASDEVEGLDLPEMGIRGYEDYAPPEAE